MSNNAPSTPNSSAPTKPEEKKSGHEKSGQEKSGSDLTKTTQDAGKIVPDSAGLLDKPALGISKEAAEATAGSLKVHVKIALEIDIRVTARIKGDIAIGIL
ncbi:hypothetical protein OHC33_002310 [Knufia fluminis]|uniref:Uncharacterized protein n=1 Tax=Knufia fluminis TaxID=191047 RepID=A0AAN8I6H0_9EURO|nr:hypothetical protein OHC33_002310 [Knufia fluminis]